MNDAPKKILFVHYGDEGIRGSERCLIDLIKHIDKAAFTPVLWCNQQTLADEFQDFDLEVIVESFNLLFSWGSDRFNFSRYFELKRSAKNILKRYAIDVVHTNSAGPNQWMMPVAKELDIPVVNQLHASYMFRDRMILRTHEASHTITVNELIAKDLILDGKSQGSISVVTNGIDVDSLDAQPEQNLRHAHNAQDNDFVIATVGALVEGKGIDTLISAMSLLVQKGYPIKLWIMGDGCEKADLEQQVLRAGLQNSICFLGQTQNVVGILKGSVDLFVSATKFESFGLVFAEAGLAKLATIAPDVGGISSVVKHGQTGVLLSETTPETLSDAIENLFLDQPLRTQLALQAHSYVLKNFTITRNVSQIQQIYRDVIKKRLMFSKTPNRLTLAVKHIAKLLLHKFNARLTFGQKGAQYE
jgi:glycosyltransferase involved in cell wall biosynthesis